VVNWLQLQEKTARLPLHRGTEEGWSTEGLLPSQSQLHLKEVSCTYLQQSIMLLAENMTLIKRASIRMRTTPQGSSISACQINLLTKKQNCKSIT